MSLKSWLSSLFQSRRRPIRKPLRSQQRARLQVEQLEDRLTPTAGVLDATFGAGGLVLTDFASSDDLIAFSGSLATQADGKIVAVGYSNQGASSFDFAVARYNSDGSLDTSFDTDGKQTIDFGAYDYAYGVAIQADGKIVVTGHSQGNDFAVARFNVDGSLDTSFDGDGKQTIDLGGNYEGAYSVAVQTDGKIVVAENSYGGSGSDFAVARLNSDGSLDTDFDADGIQTIDIGGADDAVFDVAVQADGKIVLAGTSRSSGREDFAAARLNSDGSLDTSFDSDGRQTIDFQGYSDVAYSVAVKQDGKIVIGGYMTDYYTGYEFGVVQLNRDGTLDTSFAGDGTRIIDFGNNYDVGLDVALQNDGKIIVAGYTFDPYAGGSNFAVARLNDDGNLDSAFDGDGKQTVDFGGYYDYGLSVALQDDGKVVLGGYSFTFDGTYSNFALARLDGDVTVVDTTTTATGGTFTYDGSAHAGSGTVDVRDGVVSPHYDGINGTVYSSATAPTNAGEYIVTASYAGDTGHNRSSDSALLTINKAEISYTIGNASHVYGSTVDLAATLGATFSTGVNGENLAIAYSSTGNTATANAGSYAITGVVSDGTGLTSNYIVTLNPGTLTVTKAVLTGDATTQDALNMAKQGNLKITISNVAGLLNGDTLAVFLSSAHYFITIGTNHYEFVPTSVTTSGNSITINYTLKNSALQSQLAAELADNTSGATAATAGFYMESVNYTFNDDYLTRLFSTVR